MITNELVFSTNSISTAWLEALRCLSVRGVEEIRPLVMSITDVDKHSIVEDEAVRTILDQRLRLEGHGSVQTVANTIFPLSLWNPSLPGSALYARYSKIFPRLQRHRGNQYGLYFARMMAYQPKGTTVPVNQLDYVVQTRSAGNHRRSAYQLAIIDPTRDHTNQPRRGFPCLQQVSILPDEGKLTVTGYYASQVIFQRAYGNLLGLYHLGRFLAHEMNLKLTQITSIAAVEHLDLTKEKAKTLLDIIQSGAAVRKPIGSSQTSVQGQSLAC